MPEHGTGWVDFRALRAQVSMEQLLAHYGLLEQMKRRGENLLGVCPIHKGENPTSFRVSLAKNVYHCFACDAGGNILDLVATLEGVTIREAALRIKDWFGIEMHPPPRNGGKSTSPASPALDPAPSPDPAEEPATNPPLRFALTKLDAEHPYLAGRGFSPETLAAFGVGFHAGKGIMHGRIAIPVHNGDGQLVAYAGRWPGEPTEAEPKYKLPAGFRKSRELFNLHRARNYLPGLPLIVVEGFFDCMHLHQEGHPNAVATMGASLSDRQLEVLSWLLGNSGRVIVLFDEDDAGRAGRAAAAAALAPLLYVRTPALPEEGLQPEHLDRVALSLLLT